MLTILQDVRYGGRLLARSPGFTVVAVMVLALGIGANAAIFSIVDAALLRPLPFARPAGLVMLWEKAPGHPHNRVSPLNYQDWHDQNNAFASMAAVSGGSRTLVTSTGAEQIPGQSVTREFFNVLGVAPLAGRTFTADEERARAEVVMLSERLWRSRLGADPRVIGSTLTLDGRPYLVAGIVPGGFQFLWESDLWTLQTVKRSPEQRKMHYFQVVGRLKPGVTIAQAGAAMEPVAARIARISPDTNRDWGITVEPLRNALVGGELRTTSLVLAGVVGFVLLMACANLANLMLARSAGRTREMAVRMSLGAGASRLVRQLLTESLLLAVAGGVAGLALAYLIILAAPAAIPAGTLPAGVRIALDARVAAFTALVTLSTGLLFGVAPAWRLSRDSLAGPLRGARGSTVGHSRLLGGLAALEIAIAVIVLAGAGLFLRTLQRLGEVDPGFHAPRVLTMHVILPLARYQTPERCLEFYRAAQGEIDRIPGIESASFGGALPLTGWDIGQGFELPDKSGSTHYQIVGAQYFQTLGIPLEAGRAFTTHDTGATAQVAIVNQEFVRRYLSGNRVLGTHLRVHAMNPSGPKFVDREIIGVAGQVKVEGLGEPENAVEVYVPITQNPWYSASLAIRTAGDPGAATSAARGAIAKVDKDLAVTEIRTMEQITYDSSARPRFRARLLAAFAALALILAAVGVFGVLAFSVAQRTREFGIRMALGARLADVMNSVFWSGMRIASAGVGAGLLGAAALSRSLSALLYGVPPRDFLSFFAAAGVLAAVAFAATALPALRAARIDPAITLREE